MQIGLLSIFVKISPIYLFILAGFFAVRRLKASGETISGMLIYLFTPVVVFSALLKTPLTADRLALPAIFYFLCCCIALLTLAIATKFFKAPACNILAFAAGNGNSGYYGIPVGMAILGEQALSLIVLCSFGFILYENTLGVFLVARAHSSVRESLIRLVRLPALYAFTLGVFSNLAGLTLEGVLADVALSGRHTYSVLGSMIIGMALGAMPKLEVDIKFSAFAIATKILFWFVAASIVLSFNQNIGEFLGPELQRTLLFMSTLPLAANTVVWATALRAEPERAAMAVLLSTLIGPVVALVAFHIWSL